MNLCKNRLFSTIMIPAQGAGNYSWMNVSGFKPISRVTVQPQGGSLVMDVNFFDRYMDCTARRCQKYSDVLTWDAAVPYNAVAAIPGASGTFYEGLIPSNFAAADTAVRLDNSALAKNDESEYAVSSGANAAFYFDFKLSFDKLVDTILALDKDLYWKGDNLTVTIYWNSLANYCWMGTSGTNPTTGATALTTTGAQIQNPYMFVAIEQNPLLCKEVMEKCTSAEGLSFKVGYPFEWMQSIATGGNNINTYYNSGQGSHIQKIYWTAYPTTPATPNLNYDKNNIANAKISQFQSFINGIAVQQYPFIPQNGDDFEYLREKLRGSDILSFNEYLYNWVWVEDFLGDDKQFLQDLYPSVPKENLVDGLPLIGQVNYQIVATSAAALSNYFFTVFLREIRIANSGITIA